MSRSVVDQASDVGGVVSAARMRERFLRQRANAATDEQREALSDAIGTLEVRFPELEDLPAGGAERFARERGHGMGRRTPTHEGRRRPATGKPDAAPLERAATKAGSPSKPKPTNPSPPAGGDAGRPRGSGSEASRRDRRATPAARPTRRGSLEGRVRSRGRRAWRETGIPSAGGSVSSIVMSLLGGTVGLAAAYLLLSSAERGGSGAAALPTLLDGAAGTLRRVIAPEDFFGHGLTATEYAAVENPHGRAAVEEASLAAGQASLPTGRSALPVKPGIKVGGHPLLPRQLGFKK